MQRGRMQPHHSREQVRKESLGVAQERAFALHTPQLLEERQGKHLRVGELLERVVARPAWVEEGVGVVDEAEQNGDRLFQGSEGGSMLRMGHPRFLSSGSRMAPFLSHTESTQHTSSGLILSYSLCSGQTQSSSSCSQSSVGPTRRLFRLPMLPPPESDVWGRKDAMDWGLRPVPEISGFQRERPMDTFCQTWLRAGVARLLARFLCKARRVKCAGPLPSCPLFGVLPSGRWNPSSARRSRHRGVSIPRTPASFSGFATRCMVCTVPPETSRTIADIGSPPAVITTPGPPLTCAK